VRENLQNLDGPFLIRSLYALTNCTLGRWCRRWRIFTGGIAAGRSGEGHEPLQGSAHQSHRNQGGCLADDLWPFRPRIQERTAGERVSPHVTPVKRARVPLPVVSTVVRLWIGPHRVALVVSRRCHGPAARRSGFQDAQGPDGGGREPTRGPRKKPRPSPPGVRIKRTSIELFSRSTRGRFRRRPVHETHPQEHEGRGADEVTRPFDAARRAVPAAREILFSIGRGCAGGRRPRSPGRASRRAGRGRDAMALITAERPGGR